VVQPHKNSDADILFLSSWQGIAVAVSGMLVCFCQILSHPAVGINITPRVHSCFMNAKNIATGSISAGFVLLILMVISGYLVNIVLPTDISQYGGMRAMNDPIMNLFYLYPFVIACAAAIIFDIVKGCLEGTPVKKGLMFGVMLICIMTIPSLFVMYTSMMWPVDFYISTLIWELISFPLMGILFARIWNI
jgi:hypothetical protein